MVYNNFLIPSSYILYCADRVINYMSKLVCLKYILTPWSRALLEKLTGSQLVKEFPTF